MVNDRWGGAGSQILDYLFPMETIRKLFRGKDPEEAREWLAVRWGELSDTLRPPLFRGAKPVMRRFKASGFVVGIVTNAEAPRCAKNLSNRGINDRHIDFSLSSSHGSRHSIGDLAKLSSSPRFLVSPAKKPEYKYLKLLTDELRTRDALPQEALMVGDTVPDAVTALRIGSYFAGVSYGPHSRDTSGWKRICSAIHLPAEKLLGTPVSLYDLYKIVTDFNAANH